MTLSTFNFYRLLSLKLMIALGYFMREVVTIFELMVTYANESALAIIIVIRF